MCAQVWSISILVRVLNSVNRNIHLSLTLIAPYEKAIIVVDHTEQLSPRKCVDNSLLGLP